MNQAVYTKTELPEIVQQVTFELENDPATPVILNNGDGSQEIVIVKLVVSEGSGYQAYRVVRESEWLGCAYNGNDPRVVDQHQQGYGCDDCDAVEFVSYVAFCGPVSHPKHIHGLIDVQYVTGSPYRHISVLDDWEIDDFRHDTTQASLFIDWLEKYHPNSRP